MSRFAAVPTAALDDPRVEAMHIRVLTSLCSFADKDGWCRVGQDKIAARARTNNARVSSALSDLSEWGWVQKQRFGKMKANVYQVIMDRKLDVSIPMPEEECFAETANHTVCPESKSRLPQEQITFADTANPIRNTVSNTVLNTDSGAQAAPAPQPKKRKAAPKGAARGSRIAPNWTPTPKDYAFASSNGLTREEINREADRFRNYWLAATKNAAKCDWEATWRNWLTGEFGIVTKKRAALDRGNAKGDASFAGIAASMEGHASRPADPAWSDGDTIEGEFAYAPADAGHGQPQRGRGGDREDALPLLASGQRRAG